MRHDPWKLDSCPDFADIMSRVSRLKLSERLCNLDLNPDDPAALCPDFPETLGSKSETLGKTMQFGSESDAVTLGATHV